MTTTPFMGVIIYRYHTTKESMELEDTKPQANTEEDEFKNP
jgi:hypothetical protein